MHVVLDQAVYLEVTGSGRDVLLDRPRTHDDIADEPLLGRVRGERQEYDETEDHGGDGGQRQGVDPDQGYREIHTSLARRRETPRYTAAITRFTKAPMARATRST